MVVWPAVCIVDEALSWFYPERLSDEICDLAAHAGRKIATLDDVLMATRRNDDLYNRVKKISEIVEREEEVGLSVHSAGQRSAIQAKIACPGTISVDLLSLTG